MHVLQNWKANADRSIARRIRKTLKKRFKALTESADSLKESSKIIKLLKNEVGKKWSIGLTGGRAFYLPAFRAIM